MPPRRMRAGTPWTSAGRATPVHYRETADKLVRDLLNQDIIGRSRDKRSIWCASAHVVETPNRVPMALRLVVDFSDLNSCVIRD